MLWNPNATYVEDQFHTEAEMEDDICKAAQTIFGPNRIYLNIKRRVGQRGRTQNIPDGYLLDLASPRQPKLFVVEVELAQHDPLQHIAVQVLEFSLSVETSPQLVKAAVKEALLREPNALSVCNAYITKNGYENIDNLLELVTYGKDKFNALVIIDELPDELETVLISRFKFPVEILTFSRYRSLTGERLYKFDPFLQDVVLPIAQGEMVDQSRAVDIAEYDTIVVPAREEGFQETFLGENRWYAIRIHSSMQRLIKNIAVYRNLPTSAITHIAEVASIEQYKDTNKYIVNFTGPAKEIGPLKLVSHGRIRALQNIRYAMKSKLLAATNLDEAF